MNKKYKFTDETKQIGAITLRRIKRLTDGALGGFIEKESNLSHRGDAWVSRNAEVFGDARVSGDAWVSGNARVFGDAWVFGNAEVFGDAEVSGYARVFGDARVFGNAEVSGYARVFGDAGVSGDAVLTRRAIVVSGLDFTITITDNHVQIGCEQVRLTSSLHSDLNALGANYFKGDSLKIQQYVQIIEACLIK